MGSPAPEYIGWLTCTAVAVASPRRRAEDETAGCQVVDLCPGEVGTLAKEAWRGPAGLRVGLRVTTPRVRSLSRCDA